ncbi:MAG: PepSY domain-containing protein [Acidobacteriia bacterium]|nr:PepSY domain-containing protein [Terriglobia bacterium]
MRGKIAIVSVLCVLLATSVALAAETKQAKASWTGTIQVTGKHSEAELAKMAKVSMADAEKTALAAIEAKDADKKVTNRELEVEHGYLIYSFDIKVTGKKGIEEVNVDAGDGKVLAREHETSKGEAKEKREEKAK